jgi:HEAT repeat protein
MARQFIETPSSGPGLTHVNVSSLPPVASRGTVARLALAAYSLASVLATVPSSALADNSFEAPRNGAAGMERPETESLLVDYYETFLRDHDIESFRQHVSARYSVGTLERLVESGNLPARRAAVLAMGLFGTFESNAIVARALRDSDSTVRDLADNALWAI